MRTTRTILIVGLLLLSGCSGPPRSLEKTAERALELQNAELSDVNELSLLDQPALVDTHQLSETEWCLAHEVGEGIYYASLWRKGETDWQQIELRYYESTCDWAH